MSHMIRRGIDAVNAWVGHFVSWTTALVVVVVFVDVVMRYAFNTSFVATQEMEWHLFAFIFLMGAGYTLLKDGHVRVDIFYQRVTPRAQAWINLVGVVLFLNPGCLMIIATSLKFVYHSWAVMEGSPDPGGIPFRWVIKACVPIGFILVNLQGVSMGLSSLLTIFTGDGSGKNRPAASGLWLLSVMIYLFLLALPLVLGFATDLTPGLDLPGWFKVYLPGWMFLALTILLMAGFPVTFTLMGTALAFGLIGFGWNFFNLLPLRIWGVMTNVTLLAVPLFVFMGVMLERSGLAEELLDTMGLAFGRIRGGLAISVVLVGALLGASTGIVGATVVTMGLLAVPTMLKRGYNKSLATGTVSAAGTLGQIIPPSIVLVLIGDIVGVPVGDLFMGAVLPGMVLVGLYILYIVIATVIWPQWAPPIPREELAALTPKILFRKFTRALFPPLFLMVAVLGSIFAGVASPTEAAAVGAVGATLLTVANRKFNFQILQEVMHTTTQLTCMVFIILVGAAAFGLVFRGMGGDELVRHFLGGIAENHGKWFVLAIVMGLIFIIGFFLDFIEITFIHVPVLAPIMIEFGFDPVWFCILIAVNLQTSFMTPPFGFSLFYLKAVTPPEIKTGHIYKGIIPFVFFQLIGLLIVVFFPDLVTWLPKVVFGK